MTSEDKPKSLERAGETFDSVVGNMVDAGVAAWITALTGSPDVATFAGGAAGPLAESLSRNLRAILKKQNQKLYQLILEATADGTDPEELVSRTLESDSRAELLLRASEAATRSPHPEHLRLLARLFATGAIAEDEAIVDNSLIAISAVRELDVLHLRLLFILKSPSPTWYDNEEYRAQLRFAWSEDRVLQRAPALHTCLPALTAKLVGSGLIFDRGSERYGAAKLWELTSFGRLCVDELNNFESE